MIVIACADDKMGMAFNRRRQSQDRVLISRIADITAGGVLWMNEYSRKLFSDNLSLNISVSGDFLSLAGSGQFCFAEDVALSPYEQKIEKIILFRWNRHYPADRYFDIDLSRGWHLAYSSEFAGNSHEKITMEVYEK